MNLCRDEATDGLKAQIDKVFGDSFNVNGLGAVLTCGVTGIKAGASHSPVVSPSCQPLGLYQQPTLTFWPIAGNFFCICVLILAWQRPNWLAGLLLALPRFPGAPGPWSPLTPEPLSHNPAFLPPHAPQAKAFRLAQVHQGA